MNNYKACAQWVIDNAHGKNISVLDYGCGAGQIVKELRNQNIAAYGCDVYYGGGDWSDKVDQKLFEDSVIKRMEGHIIPFENESFDFIVNKMVMEHVENLDEVLAEINRVLKPGGMVFSVFPDNRVWHEGHYGVPFLHWFAKGGELKIYYAAMWRMAGVGYHKNDKGVMEWSRNACGWVDKWTFYRPRRDIHAAYEKYFTDIQHIEDYWFQLRLDQFRLTRFIPTFIQKLIVRTLSTLVFVVSKPVK